MSRKSSVNCGFPQRRIKPQNIVQRLFHREHNICKPGAHFNAARQFYTNIFPNFTIINVEKPPCYLRKFSPDGHHFVAFSYDQTSLEIYRFKGPSAAEELLHSVSGEYFGIGGDLETATIRSSIFSCFFHKLHITKVARNGQHLNRECSLFTDNGKYVIVGSAAYVPDDPSPNFYNIYQNNESVTPNPRFPLEDYTLHIVELETGQLTDSRHFKCDKILLSHNQGLYLYKDTLAVLSIQHQIIHIYQVLPDGTFMDIRSIGRFCYEDDQMFISAVPDNVVNQPYTEACYSSLKHRLLVFLFKRAKFFESQGDRSHLRKFFQYFDQFRTLRIWKMQLLDEDHLLIKYACEDVVVLKTSDPNTTPSFFVVYNMISTQILAVYENSSEQLLELFENFCDMFRNAIRHNEAQFTCSTSSNIHARQIHVRFKQTIISAKFGGETEAVKRLLAQVPISSQSYSSSPYLDLALFSYDDKWVSVMERPKACGDHPIRFYARDCGLLKFKIYAGMVRMHPPPPHARRLVAFTFHPSMPFAISVQRTNTEYVVNFHVRHIRA